MSNQIARIYWALIQPNRKKEIIKSFIHKTKKTIKQNKRGENAIKFNGVQHFLIWCRSANSNNIYMKYL